MFLIWNNDKTRDHGKHRRIIFVSLENVIQNSCFRQKLNKNKTKLLWHHIMWIDYFSDFFMCILLVAVFLSFALYFIISNIYFNVYFKLLEINTTTLTSYDFFFYSMLRKIYVEVSNDFLKLLIYLIFFFFSVCPCNLWYHFHYL